MANEKCGFVYLWFDRYYRRYYVGSHWGTENDGYICSSAWMLRSYNNRPNDFKRRILKRNLLSQKETFEEEQKWLNMIKPIERKSRYYNLTLSVKTPWYQDPDKKLSIGEKISKAKAGKSTGPCSEEKARKISEAKKAAFANGFTQMTTEWREKVRQAKLGKSLSEEHRQKLKNHWIEWNKTHDHPNLGKKHSDEHRAKISKGLRGRIASDEQKAKVAVSNSKVYTIEYTNGSSEQIHGLKAYGKEKQIPYVTLHKAFKNSIGISKYGIKQIF